MVYIHESRPLTLESMTQSLTILILSRSPPGGDLVSQHSASSRLQIVMSNQLRRDSAYTSNLVDTVPII